MGTVWDALTSTEQDVAVTLATDYLDNRRQFPYRGLRLTSGQALQWPRAEAVDDDGNALEGVPALLLRAHGEVCGVLASRKDSRGLTPLSLQPIRARGGQIIQQSGAGFSQTFAQNAPVEEQIAAVLGLLEPLLTVRNMPQAGPLTLVDAADPFLIAFDPEP